VHAAVGAALCVTLIAGAPGAAADDTRAAPASKAQGAPAAHAASTHRPNRTPTRAKDYYVSIWGVDDFLVRRTASTNLVRFSYRVVDPTRAAVLGDARAVPQLIAPTRGVALQVPSMEQIGDLRQKGAPEAGKEYWMVFSNKGNLVRPGDRVNVVIGAFHADGLVVQ
jgi:hypothetical protein